ncbi:MAG: hypothetical protein ABI741_10385 [Ferruginibacter sp.]
MMKFKVIFCLLFFFTGMIGQAERAGQGFDRSVFYAAMSSDKIEEINAQLIIIKGSSVAEKEAYEGALLMKKAGLAGTAKEKLSLFKSGRSKLESSISKDANNTEYRFLRVIIQEHAPKIVKYRSQLEEDSRLIQTNFKSLPLFLQQVINDYSKKSKVLKTP